MSEARAAWDLVPVEHDPFADPSIPAMPTAPLAGGGLAAALAGVRSAEAVPADVALPARWGAAGPPAPSWTRPASLAELSVPGRDAVSDPLGSLTTDPTGLAGMVSGIGGLPAAMAEHRARLAGMAQAGYSPAQIADEARNNPAYNALFSLAAGPVAGKLASGAVRVGADLLPEAGELGPGFGALLRDETGAVKLPFAEGQAQKQLADDLRTQHLARGDDGLPLLGLRPGREPIAPPPHITTQDQLNGLLDRYVDLVKGGMNEAKDWYPEAGAETLYHAGGDPEFARPFVGGIAGTSQQTPVPSNLAYALRGHSQAMMGEPISTGLFTPEMSRRLSGIYYAGDPVTGPKIGPFATAQAEDFLPDLGGHSFVNDIWNMRALEYPDPKGERLYSASPSDGQHNFARIVANLAQDRLADEGVNLAPKQIQSSSWAAIKAREEGTSVADAARHYGDFLRDTYGQLSWESAPGASANHLPEYFDAPLEQKQEYHNDIMRVLTDEQGRFIPALHMGLLSGPSLEAPGVWAAQVTPGTQSMIPLGTAPGAIGKTGGAVDPASRALMTATSHATAMLLRQDGSAWNRPFFADRMPPATRNLAEFDIGRPPSMSEAQAIDAAMTDAVKNAGGTPEAYSPISTLTGWRYINDPADSGLSHQAFQNLTSNLDLSQLNLGQPTVNKYAGHADTMLERNDWGKDPDGKSYRQGISAGGSPSLQARVANLLAVLGPRIADVEEKFARNYGWTPNRATRIWETDPIIQQYGGVSVPSPPRPWLQQPPAAGPPYGGAPLTPPGP